MRAVRSARGSGRKRLRLAGIEGFSIASLPLKKTASPPKLEIMLQPQIRKRMSTTHPPHQSPGPQTPKGVTSREQAPSRGSSGRARARAPGPRNLLSYRQSRMMRSSTCQSLIACLHQPEIIDPKLAPDQRSWWITDDFQQQEICVRPGLES